MAIDITPAMQAGMASLGERRTQQAAAREFIDLLRQLGHALHDEQTFNVDGTNVRLRLTDGPSRVYLAETRPSEKTLRYVNDLLRAGISAAIDAHLNAEEAAKARTTTASDSDRGGEA